jgi:hypothetical protein
VESRGGDSNPWPIAYEAIALPLSYPGGGTEGTGRPDGWTRRRKRSGPSRVLRVPSGVDGGENPMTPVPEVLPPGEEEPLAAVRRYEHTERAFVLVLPPAQDAAR